MVDLRVVLPHTPGARLDSGERVEHEAREPRREDRVAVVDAADRVLELGARDRLRDVAAGARTDRRDDVLRGVGGGERQEARRVLAACHGVDHRDSAAVGHVHVEQHDIGPFVADRCHGLGDGLGVADDVDPPLQLGAHAGAEQLDLGSRPGRAVDLRPPAVARHPADDRLAHAAAVGRDRRRVEAGAAVADEDAHRAVAGLREDGHRRPAAELRRVDDCLPGGGDERAAALVDDVVARDDDLYRHAVRLLDLIGDRLERGGQSFVAVRRRAAREPAPQLPLLPPRQRGHGLRVLRAPLDERERLQHGVVQMGGHLRALLLADA